MINSFLSSAIEIKIRQAVFFVCVKCAVNKTRVIRRVIRSLHEKGIAFKSPRQLQDATSPRRGVEVDKHVSMLSLIWGPLIVTDWREGGYLKPGLWNMALRLGLNGIAPFDSF